jgi:alpha-D-ribose 1-methylphosphonate 5-triphosphate synthase subunit PhnH
MQTDALQGGFLNPPVDAAYAFRAEMTAMARPGHISTVTGGLPPAPLSVAAGVLVLTLCDPETPVYLAGAADCPAVRDWITFHTGAPFSQAQSCAFALGTWDALQPLDVYPVGTAEYPDRSATLIIEVPELSNSGARLTGPGIRKEARLTLPDIDAFCLNAARFPLGWDCFLTCGDALAALPRTTKVRA